MKLRDIHAETSFEVWMLPKFDQEKIELGIGYFTLDDAGDSYNIRLHDKQWKMQLRDASDRIDLDFYIQRGSAHLAEVLQVSYEGSALVKVIFFNGYIVEMDSINIGIDTYIEDTAKRNSMYFKDADGLGRILQENCTIRVGDETFFVIISGISLDDEGNEENEPKLVKYEQIQKFTLYGERVRISVEKRNVSLGINIFIATRLVCSAPHTPDKRLRLVRGLATFSNLTNSGYLSSLAKGSLDALTKERGSYLKEWDVYGEIEGEMLLKKARAVGKIEYTNTEKTSANAVMFYTSDIPVQLSEGDTVELTAEEPLYLVNPNITWAEYSTTLHAHYKDKLKEDKRSKPITSVQAEIKSISPNSIELALALPPQGKMFIILSIRGETTQIERQMVARASIQEGKSANSMLGMLIEENGTISTLRRITKMKPLTYFVTEKIFKQQPTEKQMEAIEIALNTPDIALIQGPPGTGKTTVIAAILERLNEESDKTKSIRGKILVSAFQHGAVENIVSRLSINALPTVKFGRRSSDYMFTGSSESEKIQNWSTSQAEALRKKNPQLAQTEEQVRLSRSFHTYSLCPSKNNTTNLMNQILAIPRSVITEEISSEATKILLAQQSEQQVRDTLILRMIRSLRISEIAFKDDGAQRSLDLLEELEDTLEEKDKILLEKASRWKHPQALFILDELKTLKEKLLFAYSPMPDFRTEKPREDVLNLLAKASQCLQKARHSASKRDIILAEFLYELENNPDGVRETMKDYNFVYASTIQQSEGREIHEVKKKWKDDRVVYDTLIIDEAARATPRDLLIPMAQAEKRIILVGDHRQLPHMINEMVAKSLENDSSSEKGYDDTFIKKSMFEYLFNRLKKLEEKDFCKRTITLDAQFRTHPLLGDFVSDNFYEQYGEGYQSPLDASHFLQNLPGIEGKAAVWLSVPHEQGKEKKLSSGSRARESEARVVAKQLYNWMTSPEGATLSFAVISFYSAQVDEVLKTLGIYGITKEFDGTFQVNPEYHFFTNGDERLRIGTVDAFQGMEFDVVFLSMVRSQNIDQLPPYISNEQNPEKKMNKIFGHLMSKNRLCVSLSRQKKVLVIVGDAELVQSSLAEEAVPALKNFYALCQTKGVVL